MERFDSVVVGGGPAGLTAALLLGRSRRRVLVVDSGRPRNGVSHAAHSFLTQDGTPPLEIRRIGREQLGRYDVAVRDGEVASVDGQEGAFTVTFMDGSRASTRTVVLATGVTDELPAVDGLAAIWGSSAFHCPYCDGWEIRDQPVAFLAEGDLAAMVAGHMGPLLRNLTADLVFLTNGSSSLDDAGRATLGQLGISRIETPITRLVSQKGQLERVEFADGTSLARKALFIAPQQHPNTALASQLGCELTTEGLVSGLIVVDALGQTSVAGVSAAGDVATPMQQLATAVSTGTLAGAGLNARLAAALVSR